jgi:hypothetical protein
MSSARRRFASIPLHASNVHCQALASLARKILFQFNALLFFLDLFQSELIHGRSIAHCCHIMWVDSLTRTFPQTTWTFLNKIFIPSNCISIIVTVNDFHHQYWQISFQNTVSILYWSFDSWYLCNQCYSRNPQTACRMFVCCSWLDSIRFK